MALHADAAHIFLELGHPYAFFCLSLSLKDRLPLAVVGSNTIIEVNSKRVRGRQYPWGVAEGRCTRNVISCYKDIVDLAHLPFLKM